MSASLAPGCAESELAAKDSDQCGRAGDLKKAIVIDEDNQMRMSGMLSRRSRSLLAAAAVLLSAIAPAGAQGFPFDQEMLLEAKPLPGSRRVPMLEVHPDGKASVDLWCHSAVAEIAVTGDEIKFNFVSAKPENCTPERIELDLAMAKALLEVTSWRRDKDIVEFIGPTTFRFRLSTH
jgi:hypothetical protein